MPQNKKKKILFLYFELAGYFVSCLKKLVQERDAECHVVRQPVNSVAPFQFDGIENITFYDRKKYNSQSLIALVDELQPDVIICSGWADRDYVKTCSHFKNKIPTVICFDNPWRNTLKQNIGVAVMQFYIPRIFNFCWGSGKPQREYARKLRFPDERIVDDLYCCDLDLFQSYFDLFMNEKKNSYPKRILYVGRYTKLKGTRELWKAFVQFQKENPSEWELWCLGRGEYESEFPVHEKIKNFGFVQPEKLGDFVKQAGAFILPAYYEHWGVVVHEFAAAGLPLICSTTTSAAQLFLQEGYNGFFHKPCDVKSLVEVFKKISSLSDQKLYEMGLHSNEMSKKITPQLWSDHVMNFANGN